MSSKRGNFAKSRSGIWFVVVPLNEYKGGGKALQFTVFFPGAAVRGSAAGPFAENIEKFITTVTFSSPNK